MKDFYFTYILKSEKDNKFYTGYTKNIELRPAPLNKYCYQILIINGVKAT